jgi:hypothetical protein
MALDHYVPQVHLRRFMSAGPPPRLNAARKRDGLTFSPRTQDVCRIEDGNTNPYLQEPRAIEEFLKSIEPRYNGAVDALRAGSVDQVDVGIIAGFVAYVATCSPAAMRIHSELPRRAVEAAAAIMDARDMFPPAPEALCGARLPELIQSGAVQIDIDPKFPQSLGINQIQRLTALFQTFSWELLHNEIDGSPYVTSDFPVAIEPTADPRLIARVVPLAPDLAVRLVPVLPSRVATGDATPGEGRRLHRAIDREEVAGLNRTIVRCAEDVVFYGDAVWVPKLVARNREFRVMPVSRSIPTERGSLLMASLAVARVNEARGSAIPLE